jgi:hypothetical protein
VKVVTAWVTRAHHQIYLTVRLRVRYGPSPSGDHLQARVTGCDIHAHALWSIGPVRPCDCTLETLPVRSSTVTNTL